MYAHICMYSSHVKDETIIANSAIVHPFHIYVIYHLFPKYHTAWSHYIYISYTPRPTCLPAREVPADIPTTSTCVNLPVY